MGCGGNNERLIPEVLNHSAKPAGKGYGKKYIVEGHITKIEGAIDNGGIILGGIMLVELSCFE